MIRFYDRDILNCQTIEVCIEQFISVAYDHLKDIPPDQIEKYLTEIICKQVCKEIQYDIHEVFEDGDIPIYLKTPKQMEKELTAHLHSILEESDLCLDNLKSDT